jgi:hypothetical protein
MPRSGCKSPSQLTTSPTGSSSAALPLSSRANQAGRRPAKAMANQPSSHTDATCAAKNQKPGLGSDTEGPSG